MTDYLGQRGKLHLQEQGRPSMESCPRQSKIPKARTQTQPKDSGLVTGMQTNSRPNWSKGCLNTSGQRSGLSGAKGFKWPPLWGCIHDHTLSVHSRLAPEILAIHCSPSKPMYDLSVPLLLSSPPPAMPFPSPLYTRAHPSRPRASVNILLVLSWTAQLKGPLAHMMGPYFTHMVLSSNSTMPACVLGEAPWLPKWKCYKLLFLDWHSWICWMKSTK